MTENTGLDADLATLRDAALGVPADLRGEYRAAVKRVEAELARLTYESGVFKHGRDKAIERAEAAEARCARLQRQLDAVDAHLPPWETEPGSDIGCVGRVQTILNLKADRGRCARLQQALAGGVGGIASERRRQIEDEGWMADHDNGHRNGELIWAAISYAASAFTSPQRASVKAVTYTQDRDAHTYPITIRDTWPWDIGWDKRGKHEPIRKLKFAGALIAAEIDRLERREALAGLDTPAEEGS